MDDGGVSGATAMWIDYVLTGPGSEPRTERRELFDLIGTEARTAAAAMMTELSEEATLERGLALAGQTSVLLQGADLDPAQLRRYMLESWVDGRNGLIALVLSAAEREDDRILPAILQWRPEPLDLIAMASARSRWDDETGSVFLGRPSIWSRHAVFDLLDGVATGSSAIDIVSNQVDAFGPGTEDAVLLRLSHGITDTLIEHELSVEPDGSNTWTAFAARDRDGAEWRVVHTRADLDELGADMLAAGDRARVLESLDHGDTVVVSTTAKQRFGVPFSDWWRVAGDGTTLGLGYRGWGQETTEEVGTNQVPFQVRAAFRKTQQTPACKYTDAMIAVTSRLAAAEFRARGGTVGPEVPRGIEKACFILK